MAEYDRRYIEWLKTQDPATLTPEERRLRNLKPTKDGEVRNPVGGKKGVQHWSSYFRKFMDDEDFFKTFVKSVPKEWEQLIQGSSGKAIAAALVASTSVKCMKAIAEGKEVDKDTREMIALINKIGYGDKVVFEADDGFFNKTNLTFNVLPDREDKSESEEDKSEE